LELVARELACGDSANGVPGPPPGRLAERSTPRPWTHQSRARVASHPKYVGRTHKAARHSARLGPTPVRSGPVQSTEYWSAEPQGTGSKAGRNRHHTPGLGNLGHHGAGARRAAQCDREFIPQPMTPMESPEGPSFDFITRWSRHLVDDSCQPQGSRYPRKELGD
jgi:hypothetical protein